MKRFTTAALAGLTFNLLATTVYADGVTIKGISSGAPVKNAVLVTAELGTHPKQIDYVEFKLSGAGSYYRKESEAPYVMAGDWDGQLHPFDTTRYPDGNYRLDVKVRHTSGRFENRTVEFRIQNKASSEPAFKIRGIEAGATLKGKIFVDAEMSTKPEYVKSVEFQLSGAGNYYRKEGSAPYSLNGDEHNKPRAFDTTTVPDGDYRLNVKVTYASGNVENKGVDFKIANKPAQSQPAFKINGLTARHTVSGNLFVDAKMSTKPEYVKSVEFQLSGAGKYYRKEGSAPYSLNGDEHNKPRAFDTTSLPDGNYHLNVKVTYASGNVENKGLNFSIANNGGADNGGGGSGGGNDDPGNPSDEPIPDQVEGAYGYPTIPTAMDSSVPLKKPVEIAFNERPTAGPMRGIYKWRNDRLMPWSELGGTYYDDYERFNWRELENEEGKYTFGPIWNRINKLPPNAKFSFRVRGYAKCGEAALPQYLINKGKYKTDCDVKIPIWNDEYTLQRMEALFKALGKEFNGRKEIGFVDIGMYGRFGEWHSFGNQPEASEANRKRIIHMVAKNFPDHYVAMVSSNKHSGDMLWALKTYPHVTWRRDSLGDNQDSFEYIFEQVERLHPKDLDFFSNRWKYTPVITEYFAGTRGEPEYVLPDVKRFHVGMISNGNLPKFDGSTKDRNMIKDAARHSGHSIVLKEVRLPTSVKSGNVLGITTGWVNRGNAPVYEKWTMQYIAEGSNGQKRSFYSPAINMLSILPGENGEKVYRYSEGLAIPSNWSGKFNLYVKIVENAGRRLPLHLDIAGRRADGSYPLGSFNVN